MRACEHPFKLRHERTRPGTMREQAPTHAHTRSTPGVPGRRMEPWLQGGRGVAGRDDRCARKEFYQSRAGDDDSMTSVSFFELVCMFHFVCT
jgi:hypothetical protein